MPEQDLQKPAKRSSPHILIQSCMTKKINVSSRCFRNESLLALQVEHENWWLLHGHAQQRISALLHDWNRDRRELLLRAKVVFAEACHAAEVAEEKQRLHSHQQQICDALYDKVKGYIANNVYFVELFGFNRCTKLSQAIYRVEIHNVCIII